LRRKHLTPPGCLAIALAGRVAALAAVAIDDYSVAFAPTLTTLSALGQAGSFNGAGSCSFIGITYLRHARTASRMTSTAQSEPNNGD
jgi:hypothetical protein